MKSGFLVFVCVIASSGCSNIGPTNPHDPDTPVDQQLSGSVAGRLVLPDGFTSEVLGAAVIELHAISDPSNAAYDAAVGADGAFLFDSVHAGGYTLYSRLPGFGADPIEIGLPIDGHVEVGEIALEPLRAGAISGVGRRPGDGETGHGGLFVEVLGTPFRSWGVRTEHPQQGP